MIPTLDLRRLRYFEAAARLQSISSAARSLGIAQPALSLHIAKLEDAYQVQLFERLPRGVALTPAGQTLLAHARIILAELASADRALRKASQEIAIPSDLRIGMVSSLAELVTPRLVVVLASKFPSISPRIRMMSARQCHEDIEAARLDLAVTVPTERYGDGEVLATGPLRLVSRADPQAPVPPQIEFAAVTGLPLVIPPRDNGLRYLVDAAAADAGLELRNVIEIDGLGPRKEAVLAGLGYTILPFANVVRDVGAGLLVCQEIVRPPIFRSILFRHRQGLDRRFVERMRSILATHISASSL